MRITPWLECSLSGNEAQPQSKKGRGYPPVVDLKGKKRWAAILEGCSSMPRGPSEAIVTKFLRDALAVDAVGVPELDEKAQAKGLLGERQSITTALGEESAPGSETNRGRGSP
jgi:hypothetical protein